MSNLNEFIIELQARLNEAKSKENINADIDALQKNVKKLKLQAELDTKSINTGQKMGKQMGDSLNQGLSRSLKDVKQTINNVMSSFGEKSLKSFDLSKQFNLNRSNLDSSVTRQVRSLTKEIQTLSAEVLKTGSDNSWDMILRKIQSLYKVLNQFGQTRDLSSFQESLDILDRLQGKRIFVGSKSELSANTGMNVRELNKQFKNLGVTFTTVANKSIKLDTIWDELFNLSPGLERFTTFGEQINAIVDHLKIAKSAKFGTQNLTPASETGEASRVMVDYLVSLENEAKKLSLLREEQAEIEQMIAKGSTTAADTVIQNEKKKQQAYQETANSQKQITKDESLIKSGENVLTFKNTNEAAREASKHFKELLKDENALIAVSERFNKANELNSFTVNVKRASGEVETLRYALENIGSEKDPFYTFRNVGAVLNESGAVKQMQQMEKVITDYQTKLDNLKTKYSKTSFDYSDFENVFNNFKNGIGTVNDLKLAFNKLENSAKMGMQSLKSQKASLDPVQQALNNMRDLPTMLKNLETNMIGVQNKTVLTGISVDELTSRYIKLKSEMDATGGRVPLDGKWAKEYQKLMSDVVSATKQVTAEQTKIEKSTNSSFALFKRNFSFLSYWTSAHYIFMQVVRGIKEVIGNVHELDDALTNISYTMDMSSSQLMKIGKSSLQMAKDLNTSASNTLDAVKLYANTKETAQSILDKARPAIMLSNVTGFSGEESAKYLQTIMNQFDLTQDDLMNISDTIQAVSQNVAHDFSDGIVQINEGISTSGEVARAAGMNLADYASMIGLLVEKTGLAGSQLGNSLKTIITRTTKAGKIMGIDEGEISDAEKSLRSVGIEVRKTDGEFKDFNVTMRELSKQWDSLSDVEKSNISFNLAGTRQINVIQTLLRNWSDYEDLVNKANNSAGVTLQNQEIYAESLTGKMGELSAIWQNIGNDAVSSSFLKGFADAGIAVSSLIEKAGLLKTAMGIGIAGIFGKGRSNDFAL
jgi:TP901 family phage tail tape measure protein